MAAVSLPNGASSLPIDILGCFDRFNKIYLWLDNDEAGRSNRNRLAEKLGLKRTYIV
jgi:twinkle protein